MSKSALIGKLLIPSASAYTTLTTLCNKSAPFMFTGYIAFDSANAGAANVLKATLTTSGAADVIAIAGASATFNAVNSDTIQIKGTVTDHVNIVGEEVEVSWDQKNYI